MLKIALIGYGNMGKLVNKLASKNGVKIVNKIDPVELGTELNAENLEGAEVCIDFSLPTVVVDNLSIIADSGIDTVIGTTGWYDRMDRVKEIAAKSEIGIVYGSNFSVGMNLFFDIVNLASAKISEITQYDVYGLEKHHKKKADSPSGTAKQLADIILNNFKEKTVKQYDRLNRQIKENEFHFASVRAGSNPGEHEITFDSNADFITLKHAARSRAGFALGAIAAAKWIKHRTGLYNFNKNFYDIIK